MYEFEWNKNKAKENLKQHNVSFEEAISVFIDNLSVTIHDNEHSVNEDRFIDIGLSNKSRIIVVVYTERKDKIRIISARSATKNEMKNYENKK
jgi:uncharacterized DUF497 family protein